MSSCQSSSENFSGERLIKSKTVYRLTPEGDREMEQIDEFDKDGKMTSMTDFSGGRVYLLHWYEYNDKGQKIKDKSATCEDCETSITEYRYESDVLVEQSSNEFATYFKYDPENNPILITEVFNETGFVRRFQRMQYIDGNMSAKRSYWTIELEIPHEEFSADSLVKTGLEPYHSFTNTYDNDGRLYQSFFEGAISEWFAVHTLHYNENGELSKVVYQSVEGEPGGERLFEYEYYSD
jgi:hypothetical protein